MARATLLAILIGAILALAGCSPHSAPGHQAPPQHGKYTDKRLYQDITAEVARGRSYYTAATSLQRNHGYPVTPGFTVRLPTLAVMAAAIGWEWLRVCAFALLAVGMFAWVIALRGKVIWPERLLAAAAVGAQAGLLTGNPVIIHERWAGLFLTVALAARIGNRDSWVRVLLLAAAALAVRELALPFALLCLACAAWERRGRETLGWAALIAVFAGLIAWHLQLVAAQVRPGDLASQGWWALGGPRMAVGAIIDSSPLQYLPRPLAAVLAVLPLAGWIGLGGRDAWFCAMLFTGYAVMIALFARPDNFYWGAIVQPAWFVGAVFLPRTVICLARKLRGIRGRRANLAGADAHL